MLIPWRVSVPTFEHQLGIVFSLLQIGFVSNTSFADKCCIVL